MSGAFERGAVPRPSAERPIATPAGADVLPTVRNLVPWREMERKLAERFAARAAAGELIEDDFAEVTGPHRPVSEPPPSSKVRPAFEQGEYGDVSFSVYTLADLDARRAARIDRTPVPVVVAEASPWEELADGRWPALWDPKKLAVAGAIGLAALWMVTLLAIAIADWVDPLKPTGKGVAATMLAAPPTAMPLAILDAPPAAAEPPLSFELEDEPRALASAPVRAPAPKRLPARKKGR